MLEERIAWLVGALRASMEEHATLTASLTDVQARCTAQLEELRVHRRLGSLAGSPEGVFLAEALHELALARKKYPGPYTLPHMLCVLAEESGETSRAHVHGEGASRVREEAAQTVGVCIRIAVECLAARDTIEPRQAVRAAG